MFLNSLVRERVFHLLSSYNSDLQRESLFAICNAISYGDRKLSRKIFEIDGGKIIKLLKNGL